MSRKKKAIGIIIESAKVYDYLLKNTSYLIISNSDTFNRYGYYEVQFTAANFMHLTGVETKLKAAEFYKKCLRSKLSEKDFDLKSNGTTMLKLSLLPEMFKLDKYRTIGIYEEFGGYIKIKADIAAGNKCGSLALKGIGRNSYIPCSLLCDDIDNRISLLSKQKIICIYSKAKSDKKYKKIIYKDKSVSLSSMPDEINELVIL